MRVRPDGSASMRWDTSTRLPSTTVSSVNSWFSRTARRVLVKMSSPGTCIVKLVPSANGPCSSMLTMPAFQRFQPATSENSAQTCAGVALVSMLDTWVHMKFSWFSMETQHSETLTIKQSAAGLACHGVRLGQRGRHVDPALRLRLVTLAHAEKAHHQFAVLVEEFHRRYAGALDHVTAVEGVVAQVQIEFRIQHIEPAARFLHLADLAAEDLDRRFIAEEGHDLQLLPGRFFQQLAHRQRRNALHRAGRRQPHRLLARDAELGQIGRAHV